MVGSVLKGFEAVFVCEGEGRKQGKREGDRRYLRLHAREE
jgi:hypothetical protein